MPSDAPPNGLYIVGTEIATGKSAIALGAHVVLARRSPNLGIFRPVVESRDHDPVLDLLASRQESGPVEGLAGCGVTYDELHADPDAALGEIVSRYRALARRTDGVLAVGTDFTDVGASGELAFNARVATNLGLPVLAVVSGAQRAADDVEAAVELGLGSLRAEGADVEAVIVNRADPAGAADLAARLTGREPPVYVVPEAPLLAAPTIGDLAEALDARVLGGSDEALGLEVGSFFVASMTLPNLLGRLEEGALVITGGDRADVLLGVVSAHASGTFPALSGVVLTGGLEPPPEVLRLLDGLHSPLPILGTRHGTFVTADTASRTVGRITARTRRKIDTALQTLAEHVDQQELETRFAGARPSVVTPLMFEYGLVERARADPRRIVLPEGDDDRVLEAADVLLRRGVVELTLLGPEEVVRAQARRLRIDLDAYGDAVEVIDPDAGGALGEELAQEYARRRAAKGVTLELARDQVRDVSFFGTLLVATGRADGMVSGAAHTTADTIRPALQVIRTAPGTEIVSSVFLMCMKDRVLVYGDCAVNPAPTASQLADIAISSAATAARFGVEPRVAMLSYSTGASGSGADVDKVRQATDFVRERRPDLSVDGPIQYDAAVDASVASKKLPGSDVAGRATVFIFPDLNTGNNTYKAVQRSAGAVAIGPVLQGLRQPVNDLSRGATVKDIVNTVAITAIQAQGDGALQ